MNRGTPDNHQQHLQELAQRYLGTRQPVTWTQMTDGVSTVVYRAERGNERFYLRILPEEDATFAPEARAHQLARSLGCRVPEVLAYEASDPVIERSIMLTIEIPGRPLSSDISSIDAEAIVRAAGRDLARINTIPVSGFGWVKRDTEGVPDELTAEHSNLNAMLAAEFSPVIDALPADAVPSIDAEPLRLHLYRALEAVRASGESRLAHGDFDTSHIFVHDGRYSGIIDFGEIRGMPALYDLGHHRIHDRERLPYSTLGWLIDGYNEVNPLPGNSAQQISAWSSLIAARALCRGLQRDPGSLIVQTARKVLLADHF